MGNERGQQHSAGWCRAAGATKRFRKPAPTIDVAKQMFNTHAPQQRFEQPPQLLCAFHFFQSIRLLQLEAPVAHGGERIGHQPLGSFRRHTIEFQFKMLQGGTRTGGQRQELISLWAVLFPLGLVVNEIPELPVLAAF